MCASLNVMTVCKKTCKKCGCEDLHQRCPSLKESCTSNQYVKQLCCETCSDKAGASKWGPFTSWSTCDVTCGGGKEQRFRECQGTPGSCKGNAQLERDCNKRICPDDGGGDSGGTCTVPDARWCPDYETSCETDDYVRQHCKKTCNLCGGGGGGGNSKWSDWTDWVCSVTCGNGKQTRTRTCIRGNCEGRDQQSNDCKLKNCPGPDPDPGSVCRDIANWCSNFMAKCDTDYLILNCRKTCKICSDQVGGQPKWGLWTDWVCGVTCGSGTEKRSRDCLTGNNCVGEKEHTRPCAKQACPGPVAKWGPWKPWTTCTVTCEGGTQQRSRDCIQGDCNPNESLDTRPCNIQICETATGYSTWTQFGSCSLTCGGGTYQRTRTCISGTCDEIDLEIKLCNEKDCPGSGPCRDRLSTDCSPHKPSCHENNIQYWCKKTCNLCPDGQQWSEFGICDVSCGFGTQTRTKGAIQQSITCDIGIKCNANRDPCAHNPCRNGGSCAVIKGIIPSQPGYKCTCKNGFTGKDCETVVTGMWSNYGPFGPCSKTCGPGTKKQTRTCSIPNGCDGNAVNVIPCNEGACPFWHMWTVWTSCSETCGNGKQTRIRKCSITGKCLGIVTQDKDCFVRKCTVPTWTNWTIWADCSVTCGFGKSTRTRECSVPDKCSGKSFGKKNCNDGICTNWTEWGKWSDCSTTCGDGEKERIRECNIAGKCPGKAKEVKNCNEKVCPSNVWGQWTDWGKCSKTCGIGEKTKTRKCLVTNCDQAGASKSIPCSDKPCEVKDLCNPNPCKNKGLCSQTAKPSYSCKCKTGYTGKNCDTPISGWSHCSKTCGGGTQKKKNRTGTYFQGCANGDCSEVVCSVRSSLLRNRYGSNHECCVKAALPAGEECGQNWFQRRVIGGVNAKAKQWPWMVAFAMGSDFCGGTIISKTYILSAAHCFQDDAGENMLRDHWLAVVGLLNSNEWVQDFHGNNGIKRTVVHPDYNFPVADIALVELKKALSWSDSVKPVCLPWGEETPYDSKCHVIGWGVSKVVDARTNRLQQLEIMNFDPEVCLKAYGSRDSLKHHKNFLSTSKKFMCAGSLVGKFDSCSGDSGGPLLCQRCTNCNWYIAGVVSFGPNPCAELEVPGVYTKVVAYEDWIHRITGLKKHSKSCNIG